MIENYPGAFLHFDFAEANNMLLQTHTHTNKNNILCGRRKEEKKTAISLLERGIDCSHLITL